MGTAGVSPNAICFLENLVFKDIESPAANYWPLAAFSWKPRSGGLILARPFKAGDCRKQIKSVA
jgi:hypothetical protein